MLDFLPDAYADPLFWAFVVGGNLWSMGTFLLVALPLTILADRDPAWARPWRIQAKAPDVDRWFWPGLRSWGRNNALFFGAVVLAWPLLQPWITLQLGPLPAWWIVALQVVGFVYLDDLLYYGMHRAMHTGWLWKHVHKAHHKVVRPCAVTGHLMHPAEFALTATLMLVGPLLLGVHVVTLYVWIAVRQLEAAEGHGGYHLPFSPLAWLPGGEGADHHDAHHAKFHGNYAGILGWTDRVFGTRAKGYTGASSRR